MSILVNRQPKAKARPKRQRFFSITFTIEADSYAVSRLPADPSIARAAYRLRKLTAEEPTSYDVCFTEHGPTCECLGFLRHGTACKHIRTVQAAAAIFEPAAPAVRAANVA
jgi:hypothetical protein